MAGLATYRKKRRFAVTKEPRGKVASKRGRAFVIQKHAARRLHYDLRLELNGVMKSWAVTRGPSLVPGAKRLAVQVEDHPIEYNTFEGTIPPGEYGGGTVMIWDRGTWQPEGDAEQGVREGQLSFRLDGEKLQGGWHLVRMRRRAGATRDNWLLIKQHDAAARGPRDPDILVERPLSVASGRSLEEIAAGAQMQDDERANAQPPPKKRSSNRAKRTKRDALPAFVTPCLATLVDKTPDSERWIHEIKFDGYRIQARLDRGKVKLLTRKGLDWTKKFPTIAAAIARLPADSALIDGELVAEDTKGISRFSLLQQDLKAGRHDRMVLYAFDLTHLDGADLRPLPLNARKAALAKLIGRARGPLRLSESLTEPGLALFRQACKMGLEGIISKLADAPYHSGRGHDWLKSKCYDRQEFVVAGFAPSSADAHAVGALVLAVCERGKLRYAGRTGTGFTHESAHALYRMLKAYERKTSPFQSVPKEERGVRTPVWVEPKFVVEVDFRGWTHGDRVRQASFQGLREDKPAKDVVREVTAAATARKPAKQRGVAHMNVDHIRLSHPDRIYWCDVNVTKRDLADYYSKVWPWMRPHVVGRPLALLRCPEGAEAQCFFQKHATAGIETEHLHLVTEKGKPIIAIDDLDGLIALVQGGVLEVHVRGSTIDDREHADRLVFDLDPGPGTDWHDMVAAAREVRERLRRVKLESFVRTTGGKGLHVVVPIRPVSWDIADDFSHAVALAMAKDEPTRYTATAGESHRTRRIFIDYLRNSREATAIAPYSSRARAGAPVAMPVAWGELGKLKSAHHFTVRNAPQRLARLKHDPWSEMSRIKQALPKFK